VFVETGRKRKYIWCRVQARSSALIAGERQDGSVSRARSGTLARSCHWRCGLTKDPEQSFTGKGNLKVQDAEVSDLRKELERVTRNRDILKKQWSSSQRNRT